MWPWEHAAVGYIAFSLFVRLVYGRPPGEAAVVVLLVATQLPDLVDKPLAWEFGVFAGGHAIGHSAFVAVPLGVAGLLVARFWRRTEWGFALSIGWWSHLVGDILDPLRAGDGIDVGRVLWPLVEGEPYSEDLGIRRGLVYIREFLGDVLAMEVSTVGGLFLLFPAFALLLWLADGAPGLAGLRRLLTP